MQNKHIKPVIQHKHKPYRNFIQVFFQIISLEFYLTRTKVNYRHWQNLKNNLHLAAVKTNSTNTHKNSFHTAKFLPGDVKVKHTISNSLKYVKDNSPDGSEWHTLHPHLTRKLLKFLGKHNSISQKQNGWREAWRSGSSL